MSSVVINGTNYIQVKPKRISAIAVIQVLLACSLIALWFCFYAEKGITSAFTFEAIPFDGPFQLFNPMRRIAAGQTEGITFQFFHGIGIPYLHYPFFWLFGKTFVASEVSRFLVTVICSLAAVAIFGYGVTKQARRALYFTATVVCFYVLTDPVNFFHIPFLVHDYGMVNPRISLMGVRSTLPLIAFGVFVARIKFIPKAILLGLSLMLSLYLGIEQGMAVIAAFIAITALSLAQSAAMNTPLKRILKASPEESTAGLWKENLIFASIAISVAIVGILLLYVITCGFQGAQQALVYGFRDVTADQMWYFGVPPNPFLGDGKIDYSNPYLRKWLTIFFSSVIIFVVFIVKTARHSPIRLASASNRTSASFMLTYGMIACVSALGYFDSCYFNHLPRLLLLILLLFAFRNNWVARAQVFLANRPQFRMVAWGTKAIGCTLFLLAILFMFQMGLRESDAISVIANRQPAMRLSGGWTIYMKTAIDAVESHRRNHNEPPVIWSTYASFLEDYYQVFHPAEDYIIHALGPQRRDHYAQLFRDMKPEFAQTAREDISTVSLFPMKLFQTEELLRTTSWPFYEDIINNYDLIAVTGHSLLWHRREGDWVTPGKSLESLPVTDKTTSLEIPSRFTDDRQTLVIVKLKYELRNPWKPLPILGGMPRYLVYPHNAETEVAISLAPYWKEIEFPLIVKPGQPLSLNFKTISLLPGAGFKVSEVWVRRLRLRDDQTPFLEK